MPGGGQIQLLFGNRGGAKGAFKMSWPPPAGRVGQVVLALRGRARLSERAVIGCPDTHVSDSFSLARGARRDAPYHRAAWATRPAVDEIDLP
jgi:hypothetical protein